MPEGKMFPLAVRSYYSLMRACSSPRQLCMRARECGYDGLALTDRDSLAGLWEFLAACREYGLRPVIGAEMCCPVSGTMFLLVRNLHGYRNLCTLISAAKTAKDFNLLRSVREMSAGIIVLSGSVAALSFLLEHDADIVADLGCRPTAHGSKLRKWALSHKVPAVATPGAVMAEAAEMELYRLMRAIATNSCFDGRDDIRPVPPCLERPEVYLDSFAVWPEVVEETERVAERCTFSGPDFGLVMPPWGGGKGDSAASLRQAAYRGACVRYGTDLSEAVVDRLEYELKIIESMGFSSYFLVVRDIVLGGSRGDGCSTGPRICGRGSGAASLVAYCLEITNVCPLKHNLYFERFLHPGRKDAPDIDIDFSWDERDAILAGVLRKYGRHAAMVSTVIRFQPRMALRETARVFGLLPQEISRVGKLLRTSSCAPDEMPEPWPLILRLAGRLLDIPRHISVHPGGVIITPCPVSHYVPVELAVKGVPIVQWDKDGVEEAGLVKIDLLGNRSLGVIRDCISSIRSAGRSFREEFWHPEDDRQTRDNVAAGNTMGCFYIESPAMRLLQKKAGSGDFEQLVLQSSIIRPAANDFVREYVRRYRGGQWQYLHPALADVLDETFGLMVYQEDVSRVAEAIAGFTSEQADGLRKIISKKDRFNRLRDYRLRFDSGCAAGGIAPDIREGLWQMMMSFNGYSFCKAHSASYARVSYQAAYLKTHYPAEFMAAVISNQGGYYSTFAYVSEAKRLGLTVLPPCVNLSEGGWSGGEKEIRTGLLAIKTLSRATVARIVQTRKDKLYSSAADFWFRVRGSEAENRALIQAGALDGLQPDGNRAGLFWELAAFYDRDRRHGSASLFSIRARENPALPPVSRTGRLRDEYQVLGFLCDDHPLLHCKGLPRDRTRAAELRKHRGKYVLFCGWLISGKIVSTKTGEVMEFLSFEDETGLVETVFFPKVYRRYARQLSPGRGYALRGRVEEDCGVFTLTVEKLEKLQDGLL